MLWILFVIFHDLVYTKSIRFFYGKGYTGSLSSSRSFEVGRSMALFIMKWMELSLKECGMQGLSFLRASSVSLSRSAWYRPKYFSWGTIRACSKAHYRYESVKFHWLLNFSSLGIVLGDHLEESSSATELVRFLGHMAHCFRGTRCIFAPLSFCIKGRTRCHYRKRATLSILRVSRAR